ncbi:hypothetical protein CBL_00487 [Carabus blaptoides fortunei]
MREKGDAEVQYNVPLLSAKKLTVEVAEMVFLFHPSTETLEKCGEQGANVDANLPRERRLKGGVAVYTSHDNVNNGASFNNGTDSLLFALPCTPGDQQKLGRRAMFEEAPILSHTTCPPQSACLTICPYVSHSITHRALRFNHAPGHPKRMYVHIYSRVETSPYTANCETTQSLRSYKIKISAVLSIEMVSNRASNPIQRRAPRELDRSIKGINTAPDVKGAYIC